MWVFHGFCISVFLAVFDAFLSHDLVASWHPLLSRTGHLLAVQEPIAEPAAEPVAEPVAAEPVAGLREIVAEDGWGRALDI